MGQDIKAINLSRVLESSILFCSPTTCSNSALLFQFVADGVFYAELNELLARELAEEGYSGVEVRVTPTRTEIIIRATRTKVSFFFNLGILVSTISP